MFKRFFCKHEWHLHKSHGQKTIHVCNKCGVYLLDHGYVMIQYKTRDKEHVKEIENQWFKEEENE